MLLKYAWIESFADPAWLAESQTADPVAAARQVGMRSQLADLDRKIANLVHAIEDRGDPKLLMSQLAQRNAERDAMAVRIVAAAAPSALSPSQIAAIVAELGGITEALQSATPEERVAIYTALDLRLDYDDRTNQIRATTNLARVANRVGGGT